MKLDGPSSSLSSSFSAYLEPHGKILLVECEQCVHRETCSYSLVEIIRQIRNVVLQFRCFEEVQKGEVDSRGPPYRVVEVEHGSRCEEEIEL